MTKRKQTGVIRGEATARRTESDYMGAMLDAVTLDDWREVVTGALQRAKEGDPQARAWLGQYLVGKPEAKAPTPLTVVVNQWAGYDPVAEKLAQPLIERELFPFTHENDERKDEIRVAITAEMAKKLPVSEGALNPATTGDAGELVA